MVAIDLQAIGMTRLSLGTCPHLTSLSLTAPVLTALDLKCASHCFIPLLLMTHSGLLSGRQNPSLPLQCSSLACGDIHLSLYAHTCHILSGCGSCVAPLRLPSNCSQADTMYLLACGIRGCGTLSSLVLDCPRLEVLDATFCGRLGKSALAWAVKSQPPLQSLILSVCSHLDSGALEALGTMHTLRVLDLSYTEVKVGLYQPPYNGRNDWCFQSCRPVCSAK